MLKAEKAGPTARLAFSQRLRQKAQNLRRYWFLYRTLRDGASVIQRHRHHVALASITLRDGTLLRHSPTRSGFIETFFEIWQDEVYRIARAHEIGDGIVIDAGAHVGLFSIWAAREYPQCRVLAFEPFSENFTLLQQNLRAARAMAVTAEQAALGRQTGFGVMQEVGDRSLDHRFVPSSEGGVPIVTFGDVLQRIAPARRVALFKIDIEGSEYDLFEGASDQALSQVERFAIEYHDHLRPGTLDFLTARLRSTHHVRSVATVGEYPYGMFYAHRHAR